MADSTVLIIAALAIMIPLVMFMVFMAVDVCFIRPRRERLRQQSELGDTPKRLRLERSSQHSLGTSYRSSHHRTSSSSFSLDALKHDESSEMSDVLLPKVEVPPPLPSQQYSTPHDERRSRRQHDLEAAELLPVLPYES